MRYTPPAVEHRFEIEVQLGVALPSGDLPMPVWRPARTPKKPTTRYEPPAVEGRYDITTEAGRIIAVSGQDRQPVWRPAPPARD
jgi:hypothetical protein